MSQNKRPSNLWIPALALVCILGGGAYYLLATPSAKADPKSRKDLVATVERRDIANNLLLSGEVIPAFLVEVKAEVGGKVKQIHVQTGESVKKGDMLVTIDDKDLLTEKRSAETDIEGARLSVEKNKGNFERARALFDEKLISKEVFSNLESDLRISENALEKAESRRQTVDDRLSKTRILAPADGTVLDVPINEGQVVVAAASVNAGTVIMTFADLTKLLIDTHVNQVDVPKIAVGQKVQVNMQGDNSSPVNAVVEFVAPLATVKNNIKGFQLQAAIDDGDVRLKPGMSVSMRLAVSEARAAVSVPIAAVFSDNEERVVFVKSGENYEKRKITLGVSNLSFAEVVSGLSEGEQIYLRDPRVSNGPS